MPDEGGKRHCIPAGNLDGFPLCIRGGVWRRLNKLGRDIGPGIGLTDPIEIERQDFVIRQRSQRKSGGAIGVRYQAGAELSGIAFGAFPEVREEAVFLMVVTHRPFGNFIRQIRRDIAAAIDLKDRGLVGFLVQPIRYDFDRHGLAIGMYDEPSAHAEHDMGIGPNWHSQGQTVHFAKRSQNPLADYVEKAYD